MEQENIPYTQFTIREYVSMLMENPATRPVMEDVIATMSAAERLAENGYLTQERARVIIEAQEERLQGFWDSNSSALNAIPHAERIHALSQAYDLSQGNRDGLISPEEATNIQQLALYRDIRAAGTTPIGPVPETTPPVERDLTIEEYAYRSTGDVIIAEGYDSIEQSRRDLQTLDDAGLLLPEEHATITENINNSHDDLHEYVLENHENTYLVAESLGRAVDANQDGTLDHSEMQILSADPLKNEAKDKATKDEATKDKKLSSTTGFIPMETEPRIAAIRDSMQSQGIGQVKSTTDNNIIVYNSSHINHTTDRQV